MKRIVVSPTESERPAIVLGEEAIQSESVSKVDERLESITIDDLPKSLFGSSLKNIDGYREMRKYKKVQKLEQEFVSEMSKIMKLFQTEEKKYDAELVKFVCELAENYFVLYPSQMGGSKEKAVIKVVSPFFNHDELLIKKIIDLVLPTIKKTNILRRSKHRVKRLFLFLLSTLVCSQSK
jgi:hypothetical protein